MRRAAAVLVLAACGGRSGMSESDERRLAEALAAADARAAVYLDERTRGLREAMTHPPETGGPCAFALPPVAGLATHASLLPGWALSGGLPPAVSSPAEKQWARLGLEGMPHSTFEATRRYFADQIEERRYAAKESLDKMLPRIDMLAGNRVWGYELVIVTDRWDTRLHGSAYLWSYENHRLLCAAPVDAPIADALDQARGALREVVRK